MATRVFDGIKFFEQFLKRTSQGTFLPSLVQIGPAVWEEKMFKEIVDDAQRTPHHPKSSPEHKVFDGIKFFEQFLKRTSQRTFLPSLVQIGPAVWEEKMFKEIVDDARRTKLAQQFGRRRCLKKLLTTLDGQRTPHHPKSSPEHKVFDGIKFFEQFLKRTSQGTFLPRLVQIGPAVWEEKMFKEIVDDARRTPHHPKSSP